MAAKPVDGFGSYQFKDGFRFEGQWKASLPHGRGTYTWAEGDLYEGEVKAGRIHGQGKHTSPRGTIMEGAFVNKMLHGLGATTYPNGTRYTGQWEENHRHGQGTFVFANGTSWRGQWNDNEPAAMGTWRFAGGGGLQADLGPGLSVREQPAASAATLREREERQQAAEALPADRLVGMRIEVNVMGQGVVVEKKSGAFGLGATEHVVRFDSKRKGTQQLKLRRKGNGGKAFIIAPPIAPPPPVLAAAPAGADTSPQAAQLHTDDARRAVDGLRERLADAQRHCEAESAAARSAEEDAAAAAAAKAAAASRSREAAAAAAAAAAEAAGAARACASATGKAQSAGAAEAAAVKSVADLEAALEAAAIEAAEAGRRQQRRVESAAAAADAAAAAAGAAAAAERAAQVALSCVPQVYTAAQLEAATSSFAERNLLAEGGFGKVYRGVLQPSGPAVAIKVLKPAAAAAVAAVAERHKQFVGAGSFRKELEVLSKYRHANIVGLLGFCLGSESAGGGGRGGGGRGGGARARQCLVFEFMAGGSLQERLASGTALSAQERFDIASDVARGLRYLHVDADPPIIHQDVKSDNILLADVGGKLVAKVADFGTARYVPELLKTDVEHHSTKLVIGTKPYMPIEYLQSGHVSEKTDTFAFGVVVCELLTGHGPVFDRTNGVMLSVKMMVPLEHPERELAPLLDQRLGAGGSWPLPRAIALGRIARRCIEMDASRRCVVADVLPALNKAAGRLDVRLAGRGEEYDPRTGKLVQKR